MTSFEFKRIRGELGLTQAAMAKRLKYSTILIKKIEAGKRPVSDDIQFRASVLAGGKGCVPALISVRMAKLQRELSGTAFNLLNP